MSTKFAVKYPEVDVTAWKDRIYKSRYVRISKTKDDVLKILSSQLNNGATKRYKIIATSMLLRSTCKRFLLCLNRAEKELTSAKKYSKNSMAVKRIMNKFDEKMIGFSDTMMDRLSTAKVVLANPNGNGGPGDDYDQFLDSLLTDMLMQNRKFEVFEQKFDTLRRSYSD